MQAGTAPVVADVGVASRLEKPLGERQVSINTGLQQRHVGLRRVIDEDIGHVRVGIRKFQRTCAKKRGGNTLKYTYTVCPQCSGCICYTAKLSMICCRQHKMKLVIKSTQISDVASKSYLCEDAGSVCSRFVCCSLLICFLGKPWSLRFPIRWFYRFYIMSISINDTVLW